MSNNNDSAPKADPPKNQDQSKPPLPEPGKNPDFPGNNDPELQNQK
ncbi:hypothetical protein [Haliangium sp.]